MGSISGSMLVGKIKGVDIRKMGSGNAGGTNAFRTMGAQFALTVLFIDVIKGFIAVQFVSNLSLDGFLPSSNINLEILSIICGCGVVLGHVYPLYYNFKGGKGAGTMMGVLAALFPLLLRCLSRQLYDTLILPPRNHLACGGVHSNTVSHFWNQSNSSAIVAQKISISADAVSYKLLLALAWFAKSVDGGNCLDSCRSASIAGDLSDIIGSS